MRRAAFVLVPSTYTRDRVVDWLQVDLERVRLAPLGIDERFSGEPPEASASGLGSKGDTS